jgi:hypothetical protein
MGAPEARWVAYGAVAATAIVAALCMLRPDASQSLAAASRERLYICSETGKAFAGELQPGGSNVLRSPFSGRNTGYLAELCFWTKDGSAKAEPTPVLLNSWIGKDGPTFCPDCGRLVVVHNPRPVPGIKPPPVRKDYTGAASGSARDAR